MLTRIHKHSIACDECSKTQTFELPVRKPSRDQYPEGWKVESQIEMESGIRTVVFKHYCPQCLAKPTGPRYK
jgi:hypothetical protein